MLRIRLRRAAKGQGLVEYATIIALVALVSIVILSAVGLATSRNYAVVASVVGGKKNPTGSVTGLTNTISVETSSPKVTCNIASPTSGWCGAHTCGAKGSTFVTLQLYASPDIQQQDIAYSVNSAYIPSTTTGSAASFQATVPIANTADAAYCPNGIVVTAKKAITIAPVQVTYVQP